MKNENDQSHWDARLQVLVAIANVIGKVSDIGISAGVCLISKLHWYESIAINDYQC